MLRNTRMFEFHDEKSKLVSLAEHIHQWHIIYDYWYLTASLSKGISYLSLGYAVKQPDCLAQIPSAAFLDEDVFGSQTKASRRV